MSHSYSNNLIHLVFSTKERRRLIAPDMEQRLWGYIVGIGRNHGIMVFAVGGMSDHLHLLYNLPATISLSDSVRTLKANSSRWMRKADSAFAWQKGSGAFSVSASAKAQVLRYIEDQKEHHNRMSFEDEFIRLLEKHGVAYDRKFVFG